MVRRFLMMGSSCEEGTPIDPYQVRIVGSGSQLTVEITAGSQTYERYSWPYADPEFYWYEVVPKSDTNWVVHYDSIARNAYGVGMWTWEPSTTEGTYYYKVRVVFSDQNGQRDLISPRGVSLYRVWNPGISNPNGDPEWIV
jgi:hypothetical protein